jgi:hypothetical protein
VRRPWVGELQFSVSSRGQQDKVSEAALSMKPFWFGTGPVSNAGMLVRLGANRRDIVEQSNQSDAQRVFALFNMCSGGSE